jgi:biotin transport system substrate-specific component
VQAVCAAQKLTEGKQNKERKERLVFFMQDKKMTTYQLAATALLTAVMCILGPLSLPIGAVPISLTNLVICFAAILLGMRFGTLSVVVYLLLGAVGLPVFSNYGAGLAKLAGPTGGYLVGFLFMALIGGWAVDKSHCHPVWSGIGLVAGIAVSYAFGTAWFVYQMGCTLAYALAVCVYPFILIDLCKVVVAVAVGSVVRKRLEQAKLLHV